MDNSKGPQSQAHPQPQSIADMAHQGHRADAPCNTGQGCQNKTIGRPLVQHRHVYFCCKGAGAEGTYTRLCWTTHRTFHVPVSGEGSTILRYWSKKKRPPLTLPETAPRARAALSWNANTPLQLLTHDVHQLNAQSNITCGHDTSAMPSTYPFKRFPDGIVALMQTGSASRLPNLHPQNIR